MYSGLPGESITETRVRKYQKQKIKSSSALIFDEESTVKHLNRSGLQCLIWKQCMKENMSIAKLEGCGWYMKDGKLLPVRYVGEQLHPNLTKGKTRKSINSSKYANKSDIADDGNADDDDDDYIPREKKAQGLFYLTTSLGTY